MKTKKTIGIIGTSMVFMLLLVSYVTAYDAIVGFFADVHDVSGDRIMLRGVTNDDADGIIIRLKHGADTLDTIETVCFGYNGGNYDFGGGGASHIYLFNMVTLESGYLYTIEVRAETICKGRSLDEGLGCGRSGDSYILPYYCWGECTTTEANNVYEGDAGQALEGQDNDCDYTRNSGLVAPTLSGTGPIMFTADLAAP